MLFMTTARLTIDCSHGACLTGRNAKKDLRSAGDDRRAVTGAVIDAVKYMLRKMEYWLCSTNFYARLRSSNAE